MAEKEIPLPQPRDLSPEAAAWERRLGFSEAYLFQVPPQHRKAFRRFAKALLDLEPGVRWPDRREPTTREALRAALADLRVLQGFLDWIGKHVEDFGVTGRERALAELGATLSARVGELADRLAEALNRRSGKGKPGRRAPRRAGLP